MDIPTNTFFILMFVLFLTFCIFCIFYWLFDLYDNYKKKKEIFYISNSYIVGFPSGEIIFLDNNRKLEILLDEGYLKWFAEYNRFCYRDYDKKIIEKILKF